MTSSEVAVRASATLTEKIEYARFLAKSNLLPRAYLDHPENVLYAYEYGELLGLHPMAAITGIHVIDGKPSISAGLMSALVRRAGHRIRVQGNGEQARCQIVRADDPGFTYSATWTIERAKTAGLLAKTNWRNYPDAMLKARAVSEAARDACQEVLLGMQYTPDELGADDDGGEIIHDGYPTRADGALATSEMTEDAKEAAGLMTRAQRVEHEGLRRSGEPPAGAVQRLSERDPADPWATPEVPTPASPAAATDSTAGPATSPAAPSGSRGEGQRTAAITRLTTLLQGIPLGEDADIAALIRWLTGAEVTPELMTISQARTVSTFLADAYKAAGSDPEETASQVWAQFHKVNKDQPGGTDGS